MNEAFTLSEVWFCLGIYSFLALVGIHRLKKALAKYFDRQVNYIQANPSISFNVKELTR